MKTSQSVKAVTSWARIGVYTAIGLLGGFLCVVGVLAHDFWIEPSRFSTPLDTPISLSLRVGDHFKGSVFPRQSSHFVRFEVTGPSGESREVVGLEGKNPAGFFRFTEPGLYIAAYLSRANFLSLAPEKFRSYLREEGLDKVLEELPEVDPAEPVKEAFFRYAKALIVASNAAGAPASPGQDRRIGLRLELVAEGSPFPLTGGGDLAVQLFFDSQPLEGALVAALRQASSQRLEARSDGEGRVTFPLSPGIWLIKAVHMVPAEPELDAQWQSLWASLTLEIPE